MIRPTLAVSIDSEEQLADMLRRFGTLYMSEKEDGVRGIVSSGKVWSREGKLIPNRFIQSIFGKLPPEIDGEIMFHIDGEDKHPPLEHINGIVSSNKLWPARWTPMFYAFDYQTDSPAQYRTRYHLIKQWLKRTPNVKVVEQMEVTKLIEVKIFLDEVRKRGGEGICLRDPCQLYKQGRSTLQDGCLMRFKPVKYGKATVCGLTNLLKHKGKQDRNAFGLAKRDSKLSNLQKQDELGAFQGLTKEYGVITVGSGFTARQRVQYFTEGIIGEEFIYAYRDLTHKGVPRNPTFVKMI